MVRPKKVFEPLAHKEVKALEEAHAKCLRHYAALEAASAARSALIRRCLDAGADPGAVADAMGVARSRVYHMLRPEERRRAS